MQQKPNDIKPGFTFMVKGPNGAPVAMKIDRIVQVLAYCTSCDLKYTGSWFVDAIRRAIANGTA